MVNNEKNLEVKRQLLEAIRLKCTAHTSMLVREFLAKNKIEFMPQPPYSPDLASVAHMKEKRFATIEEITEKYKQELLVIPKSSFQKCFEN